MKICVLGAGALGCTIGAALAEGGADVTLISRAQAHVDAIRAQGLVVVEDGLERRVAIQAASSAGGIGTADLVIVLVKSFDTQSALEGARALVGPSTLVMSIQNGVGHEQLLGAVVGRERLLAGKTYVGGVLLEPGKVRIGVRGKETIVGELDGQVSERVRAVARAFEQAGLLTKISDNIQGVVWDKLLVNVATGALCGITRLPYGELYALPDIEDCALAAVAEAMAVAAACGIRLDTRQPREAWLKAAAGLPPEFRTSMLQSLDKGQRTEIDFINGAVVRAGREVGVPTPVNQTLLACVKGIERGLGLRAD